MIYRVSAALCGVGVGGQFVHLVNWHRNSTQRLHHCRAQFAFSFRALKYGATLQIEVAQSHSVGVGGSKHVADECPILNQFGGRRLRKVQISQAVPGGQ